MLERAREVTRKGKYTYIEYARFADDLVILIDAYKRHDWLVGAVDKRLREEFGKLQVEINDEKSRIVDLERGESFGFLGFDFRYLRSLRGVWRPHYTPKLKTRTALMRELKEVFRRYRSQPTRPGKRRRAVIERVMRRVSLDWKGAYHHSVGQHLMKSAPAPVEQHEQQGQRASRSDRDVEESGLRQRLQEPWPFAGYRAQFGIESTAFPGR